MEMNGSASQSSASSPAPTPSLLKPAPAATTPQQVAAAAAALAASRAASVSAAMRSVFGAKQQAALASAMMNASVNAAASKAKAAASTSSAGPSRPNAVTAPPLQAMNSHATSVVVMQSSFDGLPVLPPHAASCQEDNATALVGDVPRDGTVALFGEATSRAAIRAALVDHYASTNQFTNTGGDCAVSEMTLRVDTELEMLRRQCFAERNARWQFATPDDFAPAPTLATPSAWIAAPYMGPRRQTLLLRKYHDHQRLHGSDAKASDTSLLDPQQDEFLQSLVGIELVRDRVWPPKEFMAKANTKPSRGGPGANATNHIGGPGGSTNRTSSGKKKPVGMVGVVDETPVVARVCSECSTQSSALWRTRPRVASATVLAPVADEEDVCLPCFLKTQRRDLFERKAAERARRVKEEAARIAAEARALKKQQQQMQKKIRKLQQLQQQQSVADEDEDVGKVEVMSEDAAPMVETVRVQVEDSEQVGSRPQLKLTRRESMSSSVATSSYEKDTSRAVDADAVDDKKTRGRDKKSKKDKKKKKKKKRRKLSLESDDHQDETNGWDDSDSDDDGPRRVVVPSPPQRPMDGLVYADRTDTLSVKDASVRDEPDETTAKRTSHKRGAAKATAVSKKRKSVDVDETTPMVVVVPPPTTPTQRRGRKAASSTAAATVVTPTTPSATRKRAGRPSTSTKKETARERELRALGQYCPVCNTTYEEDDARPFVCCDSCEMWVHAACDVSLTPAALATLADSTEKYICPLCGGR